MDTRNLNIAYNTMVESPDLTLIDTVGGGSGNRAISTNATVGGGVSNTAKYL